MFHNLSVERLNTGLSPPEDKSVDMVGTLVSIYCFEVHQVSDDVKFIGDAIAAVQIPCNARNFECLASLCQRKVSSASRTKASAWGCVSAPSSSNTPTSSRTCGVKMHRASRILAASAAQCGTFNQFEPKQGRKDSEGIATKSLLGDGAKGG